MFGFGFIVQMGKLSVSLLTLYATSATGINFESKVMSPVGLRAKFSRVSRIPHNVLE